jgi:pimeloyl-ACP methyl ester carboxylesterase
MRTGIRIVALIAAVMLVVASRASARGFRLKPTEEKVKYGPHEQQYLYFWKAESKKPTPIVVWIHGGGFKRGDGTNMYFCENYPDYLKQGVSFASIRYRFKQHAPVPEIMHDGERAIQFIRSKQKEWNIDPGRVGVAGYSAGAMISLWIAFHPEAGNRRSRDPVLRFSSRVQAVALRGTPNGIADWQGSFASRDDPPVWQFNKCPFNKPDVHHPTNAVKVHEICKRVGIPSALYLGHSKEGLEQFKFDRDERKVRKLMKEFLFKQLGVKENEAGPARRM